jgi:GNAT superfamily N-acetyltransferase
MTEQKRILELKSARKTDLDFSWTLWREAVKPHIEPYLARRLGRPWRDEEEKKRFAEWWKPDLSSIIVLDNEPIGWLASEETNENVTLHNFCVASQHRGRGVGKIILEAKLDEWKSKRKTIVHSVLKGSNFAPFFQTYGFRPVLEDEITVSMMMPPA